MKRKLARKHRLALRRKVVCDALPADVSFYTHSVGWFLASVTVRFAAESVGLGES